MKKDVMQAVADTGILPVINITDINDAKPLARAIIEGGIKALEITLRSEVSLLAIKEIKEAYPELHILAGTVLSTTESQVSLSNPTCFAAKPRTTLLRTLLLPRAFAISIPSMESTV